MNIVHKKIEAVTGAHVSRSSLVRRSIAVAMLTLATVSSAHAWNGDNGRDPQRAAQFQRETLGADRGLGQRQAEDRQRQYDELRQRQYDEQRQRQYDEQRRQYDEARRQQQMDREQNGSSDAFRRSGRLTPDERRDLRRQINEAGADIYQQRRR